jgi:hypothetical protein
VKAPKDPPQPLFVSDPPHTGDAAIDAALAGLAGLDQAEVADHPARLQRAHETLRAALERAADGVADAA